MKERNLAAIGALLVSVLTLGYTVCNNYSQNKKIEDATFTAQGLQNRPTLRVIGQPEVRRVTLEGTVQISDNKVINRNVNARLTIETRIRVRNDGNTNAKFMFHGITDNLSGVPKMRNIMLGRDSSKEVIFMSSMSKEHYETKDILPGKEDTFEGTTKV